MLPLTPPFKAEAKEAKLGSAVFFARQDDRFSVDPISILLHILLGCYMVGAIEIFVLFVEDFPRDRLTCKCRITSVSSLKPGKENSTCYVNSIFY